MKTKQILIVLAFAIAMAMLESAVVIYLRALMYPEGFEFPLKMLYQGLAVVEISREAATLVMLVAIGYLAGHNANTRMAYFLFSFAVWDIFYYVFLKLFLNWPATATTWDVLFLIPVMWVGPVWAPILLSLTMIALALILLNINNMGNVPMGHSLWLMIAGTVITIISFCWDVVQFIQNSSVAQWHNIGSLFESNYTPSHFPLGIFFSGYAIIILGIWVYVKQNFYGPKQRAMSQFI